MKMKFIFESKVQATAEKTAKNLRELFFAPPWSLLQSIYQLFRVYMLVAVTWGIA